MNKKDIINIIRKKELKQYLIKNGIKHISLFGSYTSGIHTKDSDIDLLYEQDEKNIPGLGFLDVIQHLKNKLGKKVHMVEKNYINPIIKKEILSSKIDII